MMSNLDLKINLMKLQGAACLNLKGKTATKKCLVIPVEDADLYVGEQGIYLNATGFETKESKYGQSHFIKQHFEKEKYNAMSDDERKAIPILGNIKPFVAEQNQMEATGNIEAESADDLPF